MGTKKLELNQKILSAIIQVLRANNVMPAEAVTASVEAVMQLLAMTSSVAFGAESKEEQDNFVKDILQQAISQI